MLCLGEALSSKSQAGLDRYNHNSPAKYNISFFMKASPEGTYHESRLWRFGPVFGRSNFLGVQKKEPGQHPDHFCGLPAGCHRVQEVASGILAKDSFVAWK